MIQGLQTRWMTYQDIQQVIMIERVCFRNPWIGQDFIDVLRQKNAFCRVARVGASVAGFVVYELLSRCSEILDLAVCPGEKVRRCGVGTALIDTMIDRTMCQGLRVVRTKVRESNLDAQLFFKANGFQTVSTIQNHYDDTDEDAYVMERRLAARI
jgi:ribosomal-protein-alanine N-acetyltransferase